MSEKNSSVSTIPQTGRGTRCPGKIKIQRKVPDRDRGRMEQRGRYLQMKRQAAL